MKKTEQKMLDTVYTKAKKFFMVTGSMLLIVNAGLVYKTIDKNGELRFETTEMLEYELARTENAIEINKENKIDYRDAVDGYYINSGVLSTTNEDNRTIIGEQADDMMKLVHNFKSGLVSEKDYKDAKYLLKMKTVELMEDIVKEKDNND